MKAFESVAPLDGIEGRIHELKLEDGLAGHVIAGCPVDADARQIDRGRLRHLGESVGDLHDVVGVYVLGLRSVDPGPGFRIQLAELVALQKNDGPRAFASGRGEIVADAKIAPEYAEPQRLRR